MQFEMLANPDGRDAMSGPVRIRRGFTLVELITTVAIIGLLLALLAPAVQMSRESARRAQCSNNLKNIGLALRNFESAKRSFPVGSDALVGTDIAWSARILPFLDFAPLGAQIDFKQPWNAPGRNFAASQNNVSIYACPSAVEIIPGMQDYGGVRGTSLLDLPSGSGPREAFGCGTLIVTNVKQAGPVTVASITDGLSNTLCVGESSDRADIGNSWACGSNCFAQNQPQVNMTDTGSLHSRHPAGACGLFADGHVLLLGDGVSSYVLGAICTRNGGEPLLRSELAN
jgi:prepilin-type N-terminal cleavage/methylation domain-containing protein/prepilin-type processing-associated H-X9-DG protein